MKRRGESADASLGGGRAAETPKTGGKRDHASISASDKAPKHPSPKVTNALLRRGYPAFTTEKARCASHMTACRTGSVDLLAALLPLAENGEEEE